MVYLRRILDMCIEEKGTSFHESQTSGWPLFWASANKDQKILNIVSSRNAFLAIPENKCPNS